jgi:hypothetical protein
MKLQSIGICCNQRRKSWRVVFPSAGRDDRTRSFDPVLFDGRQVVNICGDCTPPDRLLGAL